MKKLFFIAFFAIGLVTSMQAQSGCYDNYNSNDFVYTGTNGILDQNVAGHNFKADINNLTCEADGTSGTLRRYFFMDGFQYYYGIIDDGINIFDFMLAVNPNTGEIEELDLCV
ncbi:hypothetical protein [uncultured Formosa sp.]|uniref:hypothetical protein n=1 Tax=uncultured Formosa sp. TaxID=255435 RepID=UPI00261C2E1B|nr:hypothetical protein [uncultured Formosa sp.]